MDTDIKKIKEKVSNIKDSDKKDKILKDIKEKSKDKTVQK